MTQDTAASGATNDGALNVQTPKQHSLGEPHDGERKGAPASAGTKAPKSKADDGAHADGGNQADRKREEDAELQQRVTSRLAFIGIKGAVGLAAGSIVGAFVLCVALLFKGIDSKDVLLIRVLLSCVAVFVATGFAALGFGLFLIKAEGALSATIKTGETPSTLETTAPGLAVFVCATVVMYLALNMTFSRSVGGDEPDTNGRKGGEQNRATSAGAPYDAGISDSTPAPPLGGEMSR